MPGGAAHPLPGGLYAFTGPGTVSYFSSLTANPAVDPPTRTYSGIIYDGGMATGVPGQEAVYLNKQKFIPVGKVQAGGAIQIESVTSLQPQLSMGYDSLGNLDPIAPLISSLEVQGDLTVKGDVAGSGSVITKAPTAGQGVLTINGKSALSAAPDEGTALFAEGAIKLQPVSPKAPNSSDSFLPVDFAALGQANAAWGCWANLNTWSTLGLPGQQAATGNNDAGMGGPTVRDSALANYDTVYLPQIPGWPSTTPGGNPMPPQALAYVNGCLTVASPGAFPFNNDVGMSIGRHTRLMQFLKTVDSGSPDVNWLTLNAPGTDAATQKVLVNLYTRFDKDAKDQGLASLQVFFAQPNPYLNTDYRDIDLKGLVYTAAHFFATGNRNFNLTGAIASAGGSLTISNIAKGKFRFDSTFLSTLLSNQDIKMQPVVWMLD